MKYSIIVPDAITSDISRSFDYEFCGVSTFDPPKFPTIEKPFNIGLIVGPSGSGKSTILNGLGKTTKPIWREYTSVASHFADAKDAMDRLAAAGLNSIPSWMKPYSVLSTGEKFRADMARSIFNGAIIDEFTSVVDRSVAQSCSHALQRYIRNTNVQNMVFASCHYDIIEWLQPDWVYDTFTGNIQWGLRRRPSIELEILPCTTEAWTLFKTHHYLDGKINKSARCWLAAWNDKPVGFAASLPFPNGNFKNAWRGHRTVILPDYQGLGLGVRLSDAIAEMFVSQGCRYFSKTSHPRMGMYRENSPKWKATSKNKKSRSDYALFNGVTKEDGHKMKHVDRFCFSHEYLA